MTGTLSISLQLQEEDVSAQLEGERAKRHVCWRLTEDYGGPIFPFKSARQTMGFRRQVSLVLQMPHPEFIR